MENESRTFFVWVVLSDVSGKSKGKTNRKYCTSTSTGIIKYCRSARSAMIPCLNKRSQCHNLTNKLSFRDSVKGVLVAQAPIVSQISIFLSYQINNLMINTRNSGDKFAKTKC